MKDENVKKWCEQLSIRIAKDHCSYAEGAEEKIVKLFSHALKVGEIKGEVDQDYINDIAIRLEFYVMLNHLENITASVVDQLIEEIWGLIEEEESVEISPKSSAASVLWEDEDDMLTSTITPSFTTAKQPVEVKGAVEEVKETPKPKPTPMLWEDDDEILISSIKPSERSVISKIQEVKVLDTPKKAKNVLNDLEVASAPKKITIFDALKVSGKYPEIKNEQKETVPNLKLMERVDREIPDGERIQFAYYYWVGYSQENKVKKSKNSILKFPLLENRLRIFTVTENYIIISSENQGDDPSIVILKRAIRQMQFVYEKKLTSLGQVQIYLYDKSIIGLTINRDMNIESEQQYMNFTNRFQEAIPLDSKQREDMERAEVYLKENNNIEILQNRIINPKEYVNSSVSMMDRLVARDLLQKVKAYNDEYFSNPQSNWSLIDLQKGCIFEKVDGILGDCIFQDMHVGKKLEQYEHAVKKEDMKVVRELCARFTSIIEKDIVHMRNEYEKRIKR